MMNYQSINIRKIAGFSKIPIKCIPFVRASENLYPSLKICPLDW